MGRSVIVLHGLAKSMTMVTGARLATPPVVKPVQTGAPFTDFYLLPDLATLKLTGSCQ